jgi:hypothetical protein
LQSGKNEQQKQLETIEQNLGKVKSVKDEVSDNRSITGMEAKEEKRLKIIEKK